MKKRYEQGCTGQPQEFYSKCGELLKIHHNYQQPYNRKTRWNQRRPGNGRYPGFGLIRYHGPDHISMISRHGTRFFGSVDEVYKFLENL